MLFNPWSIGQALDFQELGPHWVASGQSRAFRPAELNNSRTGYDRIINERVLDMLRDEDEFREKMDIILRLEDQEERRTMNFTIDESMSYQTCVVSYLFSLNVSHSRRIRVSDMSSSQLWTLIFMLSSLRPHSMSSIRTRHP